MSFPLIIRYSCLHSHSHNLQHWVTPHLQRITRRSPTNPTKNVEFRGFGGVLEPHYIVGAKPLDQ